MSLRVGVIGFAHEVNAFADPVSRRDGVEVSRRGDLAGSWEAGALIERLHGVGVDVIDLPVWEFGASGPLDGDDFRAIVAEMMTAVRSRLPLDALAVLGHGAGRTSDDLDPDATFLEALRAVVGPGVPIAALLDFHANLSDRMCRATDLLVGYRTNPHVDIGERLVELAGHTIRMLRGQRPARAWCRLPIVLPQIGQLTTDGEPMGELRRAVEGCIAEQRHGGGVWTASVLGGFSLGDSPHAGMSCYVAADEPATARAAVRDLSDLAWALRHRYRTEATSVADAVETAAQASAGRRAPVILADVADNPGGGAPGNTTFVLAALAAAGVDDVAMGLQCDPALVEQAWSVGEGNDLRAVFNRDSTRPLAVPFEVDATVERVVDATLVPVRGVYRGSTRNPGRACGLLLHTGGRRGIRIGVSTRAVQCADSDTLEHVGLRPQHASVVVVKSRGHFRAGFDHLFTPQQVVEVDAPGVATCNLASVVWEHLPRPVVPLDELATFEPVIECEGAAR